MYINLKFGLNITPGVKNASKRVNDIKIPSL